MAFFYLMLFNQGVSAQREKLEKLLMLYKKTGTEDTVKLTILFHIVNYYSDINPNTGLKYAIDAIGIAEKLPDENYLARAYKSLGVTYESRSDFLRALKCYQQATNIYQRIGNKRESARCLLTIGSMFLAGASSAPITLRYFNRGLAIAKKLDDSSLIAKCMIDIGILYSQEKDLATALDYFHKAVLIHELRHEDEAIAEIINEIGSAYDECNNPGEALVYYKKSYQAYSAITYEEERKKENIAFELSNIGYAYTELDNYAMALHYLNAALQIYKSIGSNDYVAWNYRGLSDIYLKVKKYKQAIFFAKKSKDITEKTGDLQEESNALENLSNANAYLKKYKKAYHYQIQYTKIRDSIENTEKQKEITQLQMQDDLNRQKDSLTTEERFKEKIVKQQQYLNKFQLKQQWFYSIVIIILLVLATSWFVYKSRLKQQSLKIELAKEKAELEIKEAVFQRRISDMSLAALRSQMNPHFIFNCLNFIKLYTTQNNTEAASDYLTKFSKLIRLVMDNSIKEKVLLCSELEALRLYLEMESMRFKEKLQFEINIEKNLQADYIELPPMLLQPYVENAIWHGLMPKDDGGKINIDVAMNSDISLLVVSITDNGIGRTKSAEIKKKTAALHKSYGMKVTSERIALINQIYKSGADVKIYDLRSRVGAPT
ncbi:MAG: tetratricopeptide repeat protein, partial [Ferruginibacter sp.]